MISQQTIYSCTVFMAPHVIYSLLAGSPAHNLLPPHGGRGHRVVILSLLSG
jgi:hypothetical protein